jgi:hypothetical protein
MNLAVDMLLANSAGNQLGVLRAKIEIRINSFACAVIATCLLRVNSRFQLMSSVSGWSLLCVQPAIPCVQERNDYQFGAGCQITQLGGFITQSPVRT